MKLPDFAFDESFNELRRAMGAALREVSLPSGSDTLTVEEVERLGREGLEIPLDQVRILKDGTLAYKNQRVVLYIRDVKQYRHGAPTENDLPRFHVSNCDKLQEMRANNRYERYVVATRDDGVFALNLKAKGDAKHRSGTWRLRVCQYCLGKLNWEQFIHHRHNQQRRLQIVQSFTLRDYFSTYGKTYIDQVPAHTDQTSPLNEYPDDFKKIADRIKRERGFLCEKCKLNLSKYPQFLHAHHKNGIQSDNYPTNITILCIADHAEQWGHTHMKRLPEFSEFARLVRSGAIHR